MGFWSGVGSALVGGLGSALSGASSSHNAAASQRRQYKYNLKLQQQQQEWQKQMWELSNFYNLPVNEVKRLLDAGINPATVFSNGGAAAAPVPMSGSSGGVSAPTGDISNVGAAAVGALNQSKLAEAQVDVAESTANKQNAEADAARASAGESESRTNLNNLELRIKSSVEEVLKENVKLQNEFQKLQNALGVNALTRDNIYTGYYPTELQLNLERKRWDVNLAKVTFNRIYHECNLLVSQNVLTQEQANEVRLRCGILAVKKYLADLDRQFVRDVVERKYDRKTGEYDPAWQKLLDAADNRIANNLSNTLVEGAHLNNLYGFEIEYGAASLYQDYENKRRRGNQMRTDQWTSFLSAASGVVATGVSGYSAASGAAFRKAAINAWSQTNRQYGLWTPQYKGGRVLIPDVGGDLYGF